MRHAEMFRIYVVYDNYNNACEIRGQGNEIERDSKNTKHGRIYNNRR